MGCNGSKATKKSNSTAKSEIDNMAKNAPSIEGCVLKFDHFENIYRLEKVVDGCPNLRKTKLDLPVFGTGQPTLEGFKSVLQYVKDNTECTRILWTNMRQEPVVYVNGSSFTPREAGRLNENMEFPGIEGSMIETLQEQFVKQVREAAAKDDRVIQYFKDTYAEHPADRKNIEYKEDLVSDSDAMPLREVYELISKDGMEVSYVRLPVIDEKAPSEDDFDKIVAALKDVGDETACFFNCQMGKGRTTTGMICACLVAQAKHKFELEAQPDAGSSDAKARNKRAEFAIVKEVLAAIGEAGKAVKNQLDNVMDNCDQMQNLRECIEWAHEKWQAETDTKKPFWERMARNFVERYCYLLYFNAYLREEVDNGFKKTFKQWMNDEKRSIVSSRLDSFFKDDLAYSS